MESYSLLWILTKFLRDSCGAKMLILQSRDTTDDLMSLWRLKQIKLQENMIIPRLMSRWIFIKKRV
ncbi:hypothetical protein Goari_017551 [Gossypium aridum]|uniref:Uncharacterized protein n=1 Tax=Gossypium aridum TaxID=34290 RepID=A0A7J8WLW9_GOSAI|nr:hypothetical protein [Gossypium aridum]